MRRKKCSTKIKIAHDERLTSESNKYNTNDNYSSRGMLTAVSNDKTESGDSSVVTRWTVDEKIVGSHLIHARNLICRLVALRVYSAHSVK